LSLFPSTLPPPPRSTLFPYTTLFRSRVNVVLASRSRDKLEALALDLVALPGRTLVVPSDVTDRLAVEALVRKTAEEFGGVDILVDRKSTRLTPVTFRSRMPSSA